MRFRFGSNSMLAEASGSSLEASIIADSIMKECSLNYSNYVRISNMLSRIFLNSGRDFGRSDLVLAAFHMLFSQSLSGWRLLKSRYPGNLEYVTLNPKP